MAQHGADINEVVERVALITGLTRFKNDPGTARVLDTPISPKSFRRIEPMLDEQAYAGYDDDYLIFTDAKPSDLDAPLNVAAMATDSETPGGWSIGRFRQLEPRQYRGRTHGFYRYVVDHSSLLVDPDKGTGIVKRWLVGSNDGVRWTQCSNVYSPEHRADEDDRVRAACGLQFTQQYFWHVELGWVGYPTVLIPTDPVGVREVFRLRDIPEGKVRRAALRHWVKEHMRQRRDDPGDEVMVREHLRGATQFKWNGLICNVEVSRVDLARAERAKAERKIAS